MRQLSTTGPESGEIAADTLTGTAAIAAHLGKTERQAQNLLETNQLPAFKLGGRWHLRKSTYAAFVARMEAKALALIAA